MGCGASSAAVQPDNSASLESRADPTASPVSTATGRDRQLLRADTEDFAGWQGDTFSPAVAEAKAARRNPNDISAPRGVPVAQRLAPNDDEEGP